MTGYDTDYDDSFEEEDESYLPDYDDSGYVPEPEPGHDGDAIALVHRAIDLVNAAKAMPLSSSVLVSREELVAILDEVLTRIPEEMRQARWLLKEREEFLVRTRRDGDEILDAARARASQMVERTEIVRQAQATARRTIDEANSEGARLRHEAEDFCDQKLAAFEIVLDRTFKTVKAGRDRLKVTPAPIDSGLQEPSAYEDQSEFHEDRRGETFFDQDEG